ncbi:hypothetical protein RI129_012596 [Pyrocoelia pectoralis]|uniref:Glucose-methanol-choline oxidoreductase N-terminal domain-containing protein n=1 Tax=Pyrocoelia pectoralis TaxID=417401 RepID=A0AAN7ZF28_9COLE
MSILLVLMCSVFDVTHGLLFGTYGSSTCDSSGLWYDYIVVGSGAAGSVVTHRLTSNENITVLLLEAGGLPLFHSDVPSLAVLQHLSRQNWGYLFFEGLIDNLMPWPRGKVLGGSSVINSMLYVRGNSIDYDRWANAGNPGWSYVDVLPYFKRSEDASVVHRDLAYHGSGGLLTVTDVPYRTGSAQLFVEGFREMGYPYVDYNGASQMGVSFAQATLRKGRRCSAEKAFIRPAKVRSNLKICLHSHVSKILCSSDKSAYGVEYIRNRRRLKAYARREVILSAGAFHSPQILMLSGIGPKQHLSDLGIRLVENLPVGEKLYDHLSFFGLLFTVNKPMVTSLQESISPANLFKFLLNGNGPLTLTVALEAFAYYKTPAANYSENYPDVELMLSGGSLQSDNGTLFRTAFGVTSDLYNSVWKELESKYAWGVLPILFHPKSHGKVRLRSKKPLDPPLLYGNYLTDSENYDLRAFISSIREVQRVVKSPIFQRFGTKQVRPSVPGCRHTLFDSDEYWECVIRHLPITMDHQTSTCKMGPRGDPEAVVDHKLRVHGVKNLRVVDTSVFPVTLSAHTNAPAYMVGEKGADLILNDYYTTE